MRSFPNTLQLLIDVPYFFSIIVPLAVWAKGAVDLTRKPNRSRCDQSQSTTKPSAMLLQGSRFCVYAAVLIAEAGLTVISYVLSVCLLAGLLGDTRARQVFYLTLPWLLGCRLASYFLFRLFRQSFRYASIPDLIRVVEAVTLSSLVFLVLSLTGLLNVDVPIVLIFVDFILSNFLLGGLHFGLRVYKAQRAIHRTNGRKAIIVGAGDAGSTVIKELALDEVSPVRPVAVVDEDPRKHGTTICGIPILGGVNDLPRLVREKRADEVLICVPSATPSQMSRILAHCRECGVPVLTLPSLGDLADGKVAVRDLRNVRIEDILHREEFVSDPAVVREVAGNRTVLVTGAGGSIGSELCRQIALGNPDKLLLLDKSENGLFYVHLELRDRFPNLTIEPLLVDVVRADQVLEVFRKHRPDVVFHAAAHKHVQMLELHPQEAIRNNVIGTRNVALAAQESGVTQFVNISTDKAVMPRNYMGLSKRITELLIQELAPTSATRFANVRFGNVAGSTGSVIRLFRDQIQKGGPIRVTDPRATRYFMTIAEAVCLILHAAALGQGGETFVFDMGEPLNIYELARTLSLFSGLTPGKDLKIEIIGLKKGEKIVEELWDESEQPRPTQHKRILAIASTRKASLRILDSIDEFEECLAKGDHEMLLARLHEMFPSFRAGERLHPVRTDEESTWAQPVTQGVPL